MKIRRYEPGDAEAIDRLNRRLSAGGASDVVFPESPEPAPGPIRQRLFVAVDGDEVRGGVWLREHQFRSSGADVTCGWLKYPVAESLVNSAFSGVPGSLLFHVMREQPRLMALGLGGHETPLSRMLARLKWTGASVPFQALLVRPARALRNLSPLRRTVAHKAAAWTLGLSGAAWMGQRLLQAAGSLRRAGAPRGYSAEQQESFGPWADEIWNRSRDEYGFIAARDAAMLNQSLPVSFSDTVCLRIRRDGHDVGWACILRHEFSSGNPDRHFGRATVGLVADMLAHPADAPGVLGAALDAVIGLGVDIVVTNQTHPAWIHACRNRGFIEGPSTFAFYRAPAAQALVSVAGADRVHVNRGDCDGPLWYAPRGQAELQAERAV